MTGLLKRPLFRLSALGGLLVAYHLSHWTIPPHAPLEAFDPGLEWIGTPEEGLRGYFRRAIVIPFRPVHAWISISADDHRIYVNGAEVSANEFLINSSLAFQNRLSQRAYAMNSGKVLEIKRAPELRRAANEEWRTAYLFDITPHLKAGRNTLAVYVQSNARNRFALRGAVEGDFQRMEISSLAADWKSSPVSVWREGHAWHSPAFNDDDWAPARGRPVTERVLALAPGIWTTPFKAPPVSGPLVAGQAVFKTELPARALWRANRGAWIRVGANLPFSVLIDDVVVGSDGGRNVSAFDISRHLGSRSRQLSVVLQRPGAGGEPVAELAVDGSIGGRPISTESGWSALNLPHPGWIRGRGDWSPVRRLGSAFQRNKLRLRRRNDADSYWLLEICKLWLIAGLALALAGRVLAKLGERLAGAGDERLPYWILLPPLIALAGQEFMRFRFQESDAALAFADPAWSPLWLGLGPAALALSMAVLFGRRLSPGEAWEALRGRLKSVPWLPIILLAGAALRLYNIGFENLQADENVSWDAARGILRTGAPEAVSGVLYTRSPLYHYLLAGWIAIFGDHLLAARSFSVVPGVGVIVLVYLLVEAMTKRRYLALGAALLIAVDPWQIQVSRNIRFYQQVQFFSLLSTLLFLKGFVWKEGRRHQNRFFLSAMLAVLSQEVFVTTFPAYCVAFYMAYRPFDWRADRNILKGFALLMLGTVVDGLAFTFTCLTPHVGIGTSSGSIIQFHLRDMAMFAHTFLYGNNRAHVLYSLFFLGGVLYWAWRKPRPALAVLYAIVVITLATLTLLVQQLAGRYGFLLYPYLVVCALITADDAARALSARMFAEPLPARLRAAKPRWTAAVVSALVVMAVANLQFGKLAKSYKRELNFQHEDALRRIHAVKRPTDKVMSVYPMPAAIVLGGIDYYLAEQLSFDELHRVGRGTIDRWAGGRIVSKIDQLRELFARHRRLWILLDEAEVKKFSEQTLAFIRSSCRVQFELFGVRVYLWDQAEGRLALAPDEGGRADEY